MATIRDVAARAKVSVATVSRVLNESGYADSETRVRVLKAAADLHYRRNVNWSRLKSQSSQTVLFLLGNRQSFNAFHMRLLVACEKTLQARGYDLIFSRYEYSGRLRANEVPLPRMLDQTGALDGVLLAGVHHPNLLQVLDKRRMPYSLLGNSFEGPATHNSVFYDDCGGIEEAAGYLIRLGHRRIAFLGNVTLPWFRRRCRGYEHAMEKHGLKPLAIGDNWQVANTDYGQLATAQLLRESRPPTAIIAGDDELAAGAWKELIRRRVSIPRDMSLIGLGDRAEFAILEPALSSISVFEDQLGERLTSMLLARIEDPKHSPASETYPCKLIERASCAPVAEVRTLQELKRKVQ
ncbi:MAG: LacI family DNA-binding transcriptional regulator [Bryobacteraceae bacterium]